MRYGQIRRPFTTSYGDVKLICSPKCDGPAAIHSLHQASHPALNSDNDITSNRRFHPAPSRCAPPALPASAGPCSQAAQARTQQGWSRRQTLLLLPPDCNLALSTRAGVLPSRCMGNDTQLLLLCWPKAAQPPLPPLPPLNAPYCRTSINYTRITGGSPLPVPAQPPMAFALEREPTDDQGAYSGRCLRRE